MKTVVLLNPSVATLNLGDAVIFDSIEKQLRPILQTCFRVDVSTHLPWNPLFLKLLSQADYRFACGTNLLRNMHERFRQWDIGLHDAKLLSPVVLIGVGWQQSKHPLTPYTKAVYKRVLSREGLHSVRDEFTLRQLQALGFNNVVNTGCPTTWDITPEACARIPVVKAQSVVFTLTDYHRDRDRDRMVVDCLLRNYDRVYLWIQGFQDYDYANDLGILEKVELIGPSLKDYDGVLMSEDVEYIGTRLHGGIRAIQHGRRAMILAVDSRAVAMKQDIGLPVVERMSLDETGLKHVIYDERPTEITIRKNSINAWKDYYELNGESNVSIRY